MDDILNALSNFQLHVTGETLIRTLSQVERNSTAEIECMKWWIDNNNRLAKGQSDVRVFLAHVDLTACRWRSTGPVDRVTRSVRGSDRERVAREWIPKYIREVVPDLAVGQRVGIVGLR